MAGLFFELFLLIALIGVSFVFFSFWKKKFWPLPFGVGLFVLNGALLLSEGLRYESGSTLVKAGGINTVTYVFSTATAALDASILLTGWTFIGLGIVLGIVSFALLSRGGEF